MYVYLIGHSSNMFIHTYIGVTDNFDERLKEHNDSTEWFPIMVLECPNRLASQLQAEWGRGKFSAKDRIRKGFKLVNKYCIVAYVADIKLGLLSQMPEGEVKTLGAEFWDAL